MYIFQGLRKVVFGICFWVQAIVLILKTFGIVSEEVLDSFPSYLTIALLFLFYFIIDRYASKREFREEMPPLHTQSKVFWGITIFLIVIITSQLHKTFHPPILTLNFVLGILFIIFWFIEGRKKLFALSLGLACVFIAFLPLFSFVTPYLNGIENIILGAVLVLSGILEHRSLTMKNV